MHALSVQHLSKIYVNGTQALKDVSFAIEAGDFCALLGANGAGKTTLIGIVTDLLKKTSGEVKVFDHNIDFKFSKAKQLIGVVPQEFNFNIFEKVQDILVTQAGYFGIDHRKARMDSEVILKRLGLWSKKDSASRTLSGGMKRRLMIARALIHHPKLLILDEPTAGVDVELRHGMWDYLKELNQQGMTILLTTHYLEEVEQLCRNVAILKNGELVTYDRVYHLMQRLEKEIYLVTVDRIQDVGSIQKFGPMIKEENTFEVELSKSDVHDFILKVTEIGMTITDFRSQGHRLEKLYLKILKT
ncbi:MAG: ABC transporter ATP-binding protein [Candidatus Omnitrophica bacterium]|nr:ABC transporter ATP-binding protein [Candidatus Omnitrophota bacterium]